MATGDPYISTAELADFLGMDAAAEAAAGTLLEVAVDAASRWVEGYTRRDFNLATAATARYYDTTDTGRVLVDDIGHATVTVATDTSQDGTWATSWAASDLQVSPLDALAASEPVTSLLAVGAYTFPEVTRRQGLIRVTARWGWPAVPDAVKQATYIHAARLYKRRESPTGVLGGGDFGLVRVGTIIDPDVEQLLGPYRYLTVG